MYNVLEFLRFPSSYISWIKLLNTSSVASIVQVGVFKPRDPISPYLFILCGQIMCYLCYLIKHNPNIKGINIGENEFKISGLKINICKTLQFGLERKNIMVKN